MHPRVIRIIARITQLSYAITWRGNVQMILRDLSMPFKGFCITQKPNCHIPPGGTAGQGLPAHLAGPALIAQKIRYDAKVSAGGSGFKTDRVVEY